MIVAVPLWEVLPVAGLPCKPSTGVPIWSSSNNTPTYLNVRADVILMDDVATTLPEIAKRVFHG